jgi:hypothetical protein
MGPFLSAVWLCKLMPPTASCASRGARPAQEPGGSGQLQLAPLRVKLVGEVSLAVQVPWKPMEALAPGLIVPS